MARPFSNWRYTMAWANTRGRTLERQADGLRQELGKLAASDGDVARVREILAAMRYQLDLVEQEAPIYAQAAGAQGAVLGSDSPSGDERGRRRRE